jgi:hemoglobin/transferrin/lactoferrin receptor protein
VLSLEGGLKYEGTRLRGSVFYFHNRFTDHLVLSPTTFDGLPFADPNGNRRRDPGEGLVVNLDNVGEATIYGVESHVDFDVTAGLLVSAHYSYAIGTDDVADGPLTLMPPHGGAVEIHYSPAVERRPWFEIDFRFSEEQDRLSPTDLANAFIGPGGVPAFQVLDLRGGLTLFDRLALSLAVENVLDRDYKFMGSNRYQPGRQLVVGTTFRF